MGTWHHASAWTPLAPFIWWFLQRTDSHFPESSLPEWNNHLPLPNNVDIQSPENWDPLVKTDAQDVGGGAQLCRVANSQDKYRAHTMYTSYGYGSIPIHTIFRGMNIHLPAILMFTRGTRFWHTAIFIRFYQYQKDSNALFDIIHTLPDYCSAAREGPLSKWWKIQILDASQYDDCYKSVQAVHSLKIGDESSRSRVNKSTSGMSRISIDCESKGTPGSWDMLQIE